MPSDAMPTSMPQAPQDPRSPTVMGLRLMDIDRAEITRRVVADVLAGRPARVVNANAHCVTLAQSRAHAWMRDLFANAEIAFCDGAGVQLASLFLSGRSLPRTTPPEWVGPVCAELGERATVFWLGGESETVGIAARSFETRYGCRTAGTQHGFFDMTPGSADNEALLARITAAAPNILLLNMGMPRQELWLWENWDRLPPLVAITAGALVDHAAGRVRRPPRWVANMGLEWAVRLGREPGRLWKRYLLGLPKFAFHALAWRLKTRS